MCSDPTTPSARIRVAVLGCWGMQLFWEGGKSRESDQKRSWWSSSSPRSSLQLQPFEPFVLSGCSQGCILAEITSPSIQAAISPPPPLLQWGRSTKQYKYRKAASGGLVTLQ